VFSIQSVIAVLLVRVLHTPGHTADSVSLLVEGAGERVVVSGDTILGVGTPVLDERPGSLRAYLSSLDALLAVGPARLLPGHGPEHPDLLPVVRAYRRHRELRLTQIRSYLEAHGLSAADADARSVATHIYPGIAEDLIDAAGMSARAQLDHLADLRPG
jgi:glyoxylase-like metal-dependent hydrolase (beta-lactamase superfamily II)